MTPRRHFLHGAGAALLAYGAPAALLPPPAAAVEADAVPKLDVPYVPTPMPVVDAMLDLAQVNRNDTLCDLGCGDGRIVVRAAQRFRCRGVGVDLDPRRVAEARANATREKVTALTRFEVGDVFDFDFSQATVVTMYLLPSINLKLRPRLLKELAPGTRIVSHDFDMGDWEPKTVREVLRSRLYLWTVPARG
jgi:trans-aconitate methyltransferase